MADLLLYFAAAATLAGAVAALTFTLPRALWLKFAALGAAGVLATTVYYGLGDMLGRPKPVSIAWLHAGAAEAQVVASQLDEPRAVYLWLRLPGVPEPRAFSMPWDEQTARELAEARRTAEQDGTEVVMRMKRGNDEADDEPMFYAEPQPALPPKQSAGLPPTAAPDLPNWSGGSNAEGP